MHQQSKTPEKTALPLMDNSDEIMATGGESGDALTKSEEQSPSGTLVNDMSEELHKAILAQN